MQYIYTHKTSKTTHEHSIPCIPHTHGVHPPTPNTHTHWQTWIHQHTLWCAYCPPPHTHTHTHTHKWRHQHILKHTSKVIAEFYILCTVFVFSQKQPTQKQNGWFFALFQSGFPSLPTVYCGHLPTEIAISWYGLLLCMFCQSSPFIFKQMSQTISWCCCCSVPELKTLRITQ